MFTRLWQHRYSGLLATLLVGLAAAVLVMLLPDRQQAFARFMVDPAIADGQLGPQSLMSDQRLISRVLQRLEIDSPNFIDPRSVDPLTAFKRNFGLRPTGTPGEFEISYVSRSSEQAAEGVKTWLSVASDVWRLDGPADAPPPSPANESAGTLLAEVEAAKSSIAATRDRQQALSLEQLKLTERLASAQAAKERFEAAQARAATALASARKIRETQRISQAAASAAESAAQSDVVIKQATAELDSAEKNLGAMRESLAQASAQAKQAADRLVQVKQERVQAGKALASAQAALRTAQAAKTDFAQVNSERVRNIELARNAQADRQRVAIEKELKQAVERGTALERKLEQTSPTIVEVVTEKSPIAQAGDFASRQRLITKTKAELTELRVRFTDNHPDVRRQLAILSDLESAGGENSVIEAPTVGARPEVRPNPQLAIVREAVEQNQAQIVLLRKRVGEMKSQRKQLVNQQAPAAERSSGEQENKAQLTQAQRLLTSAQAAVTGAEKNLQDAEKSAADTQTAQRARSSALESAEGDVESRRTQLANAQQARQAEPKPDSDSAPDEQPTAAQLAKIANERQALDDNLKSAEQSLASVQLALNETENEGRQAAESLAALQLPSTQSASTDTKALGLARGGMTLVQSTQVVPASSSPDRIRFLLFGLVASLILGGLVALMLGARRTAFNSVAQLEQATGLRALGGVPRFSTSRQTMGFWVSAAWFVLLIIIYGLAYLGFIALVESGSNLLQPDWTAWREAGLGLLRDGAVKIGVGEQWLAGLGENR